MDDPWALHRADELYYGVNNPSEDLHAVLDQYEPYLAQAMAEGVPLGLMLQHLLALFHGQRGAKQWRRYLTAEMYRPDVGLEVLRQARTLVSVGE
jgi:tRNA-dihydrouridine synthase A